MRALEQDVEIHSYRTVAITRVSETVAVLQLMPDGPPALRYRAGQYVTVGLDDGTVRVYSPATPMQADGCLELHVRLFPNGRFSQRIGQGHGALGPLKVCGPFGQCVWPDSFDQAGQAILLATGTGIAPVKALVEEVLTAGKGKAIHLYWGAATRSELYLNDEFVALEERHPRFHFVPVVSRGDTDGRATAGYVQEIASSRHASLASAWVFACGRPDMVSAAARLLSTCNALPASRFYADAFNASDALQPVAANALRAIDAPTLTVNVTCPGCRSPETVQVRADASLMSALRDARFIQGVCNGQQSCGTCRLTLPQRWFEALPPATRSEARLLRALPGAGPRDRLACQIVLTPDLEGIQVSTH